MKKIPNFLILLGLLFFAGTSTNQAQTFKEQDKVINLGIGFGTTLYTGYSTTLPPVSISADLGLKGHVGPGVVGIGAYLGIAAAKYESSNLIYAYGYKYTYTIIGLRAAYHLVDLARKLDVYGGAMIGYDILNVEETGVQPNSVYFNPDSGGAIFCPFLGARYYLINNVALMGELGYGVSYLNLGVAFKLR
jgi:hypothetical protein